MTKKELMNKLQDEYLDNLSMAWSVRYRSTIHKTDEQGRADREAQSRRYIDKAYYVIELMRTLGIPQTLIDSFNKSRMLSQFKHPRSIPSSVAFWDEYDGFGVHSLHFKKDKKLFDRQGFRLVRDNNVLDLINAANAA